MRTVSYTYYIDDIDMDFDSKGFIGSKVSVDLVCQGASSIRDCRGNEDADPRTLAIWRSDGDGTEFFDSDPPPITAGNLDQISYMEIFPRITVDPPGKLPPLTNDGAKENIRADSADYLFAFGPSGTPPFNPKEGAIFAGVKPTFFYDS